MIATTKFIKKHAGSLLDGIVHLLYPQICLNCSEPISTSDNNLCQDCWHELLQCAGPDYCRRCGLNATKYAQLDGHCPNCLDSELHYDKIARGGTYAEALRSMILAFKSGRTELSSTLTFLADSALAGAEFREEITLFTPVPLHWRRRLKRGYNQSMLICKKLAKKKTKISADLVRIRYTKPQASMTSPAARKKNVEDAFAVRRGHKFAGQNVCLVDDIKTTNATLNECAKTLKQAGAKKVFAVVISAAGQEYKT